MRVKTLITTSIAGFALLAAVGTAGTAAAQSSLRVGQTVSGTLSSSDPVLEADGSSYDCYVVSTRSGQGYTIDMESGDFDTFVAYGRGRDCQDAWVDGNDDRADGDTNSRLTFTAEGGDYFILANSYAAGESGAYRLSFGESRSAATPARSDRGFVRPTDPNQRYAYDVMCASMGTVGLLLMLEEELSDEELEAMFEENGILIENANASGAALGMTREEIEDELVMNGAAMLDSDDIEGDFSPVQTRQNCLDASGR